MRQVERNRKPGRVGTAKRGEVADEAAKALEEGSWITGRGGGPRARRGLMPMVGIRGWFRAFRWRTRTTERP